MSIKLLSIFTILCLGILVYSNTFFSSFHFDDYRFITLNPAIRDLHDLPGIWQYYHGRFITFLSFAFNYHFNGLNVFGYHLFNVAVHLICACLVCWLVLLTFSTPVMKEQKIARDADIISFFAGLVFVCHPVQVEAVTYIWQRAASLMTMFYLASLCFYVRSRLLQDSQTAFGPGGFYYSGALITAVLAMFMKENSITLPLVISFYEFSFFYTKKSFNWSSCRTLVITRKGLAPFLLTLLIVPLTLLLSSTQTFQDFHGTLRMGREAMTREHYFLTQFRVMITYLRLAFLPINQNLDYDYPVTKSILETPWLISFLFLAGIFYFAKGLFSKYRLITFSIFWFFLTLVPESSFILMGNVIYEHRLYLPLAGYSIFLVSGMYYLVGKNDLRAMVIGLTIIIAFYSVLTYQRNKVWKNDLVLWSDVIQKSPDKARAYNNRGVIFGQEGQYDRALADLNKAIEIYPEYATAYLNLGKVYYHQNKFSQAMSDLNKSIELDPDSALAYSNRGLVYLVQNDLTQALSDCNKAVALDPLLAEARIIRAKVIQKMEQGCKPLSARIFSPSKKY